MPSIKYKYTYRKKILILNIFLTLFLSSKKVFIRFFVNNIFFLESKPGYRFFCKIFIFIFNLYNKCFMSIVLLLAIN